MNHHIKTLAIQAGFKFLPQYPDEIFNVTPAMLNTFAELLIRQCAHISIEADDTCTSQGMVSANAFMNNFGIKC